MIVYSQKYFDSELWMDSIILPLSEYICIYQRGFLTGVVLIWKAKDDETRTQDEGSCSGWVLKIWCSGSVFMKAQVRFGWVLKIDEDRRYEGSMVRLMFDIIEEPCRRKSADTHRDSRVARISPPRSPWRFLLGTIRCRFWKWCIDRLGFQCKIKEHHTKRKSYLDVKMASSCPFWLLYALCHW